MASRPDDNPDSPPAGPSDDIERITPDPAGRDSVEDTPGTDGETGGTDGTSHREYQDIDA